MWIVQKFYLSLRKFCQNIIKIWEDCFYSLLEKFWKQIFDDVINMIFENLGGSGFFLPKIIYLFIFFNIKSLSKIMKNFSNTEPDCEIPPTPFSKKKVQPHTFLKNTCLYSVILNSVIAIRNILQNKELFFFWLVFGAQSSVFDDQICF